MNDLIKVNYTNAEPTVSARELHQFLELGTEFRHWFPRMCEYGFSEGIDYTPFIYDHPKNHQPTTNYQISISMAKEICMIQRNEKGKIARQYFIALEKSWNTPEIIMARALKMADSKVKCLQTENSRLVAANMIMQPKSLYFDELVERHLLTNFRDTAKELKVGERVFIKFLLDKKYVYRDNRGKIKPFADKNNGLFEIKEAMNEKSGWVGTQTLITPKGRETFRLLITTLKEATES